jgi:hypothetical protein
MKSSFRSFAAEACSFEAPKEPKVLSAERLLCRTGLSPATRAELTGWENLPLASPLSPRASANIPYALPPHRPPRSTCFRPKLLLLNPRKEICIKSNLETCNQFKIQ